MRPPRSGSRPARVVVVGAGDRACEVLGAGATAGAPMVSWGTTANVSVPHPGPMGSLPAVAAVSRGALGGFVVEAGLSAAGAALGWLATTHGERRTTSCCAGAATWRPGRAGCSPCPGSPAPGRPWWRPDAHGGVRRA